MSKKILRLPEVKNRTGRSRSWIYAMIPQGKFPIPISLGERSIGWVESEIDHWIDQRARAGFVIQSAAINEPISKSKE